MEAKTEMGVRCPYCGRIQKVTRWRLVNLETEPLAKLRAMKGTLLSAPCEKCGETLHFRYGVIVYDPAHRAMVYLCPEEEEQDSQTLSALPPEQGYKLRLVYTEEELAEKLQIFDAGLEDTVIELVKVFYFMQFHQGNPEETVVQAIFSAQGEPCIQLRCKSGKSFALPLKMDYYKKVQAQYQERIWRRSGPGMQRIDAAWTSGVLEL